jgi:hypothetical protein
MTPLTRAAYESRASAPAARADSGKGARSWRADREAGHKTGLGFGLLLALLLSLSSISSAQASGGSGRDRSLAFAIVPASILADAEALLDPHALAIVIFVGLGLVLIVMILGSLAAAVLAVLAIVDRLRGKRETTNVEGRVETRRSEEGPKRMEFDLHVKGLDDFKAESRAVRSELMNKIDGLGEKLDRYSSDNYKRRRAMHREINNQREALAFLAGEHAARGDAKSAEHIRALIHVREEDEAQD